MSKNKRIGRGSDGIPGWGSIRKEILERDRHRCRICGQDNVETKLHVHHIDYDRRHNETSNLVTLCMTCHSALHAEGYQPFEHPDWPIPWGAIK